MAVKIALDVQGSDHGMDVVIAGARRVAAEGVDICLYGPEAEIEAALGSGSRERITYVHSPDVITNHDDPASAVRGKRESSIVMGAKAVGAGEADAFVSAGPTGALLAASLFNMKRIKGVKRPAIAVIVPNARGGRSVLLDAGANVEVPATMLLQFAALGAQFSIRVLGVPNPKVGLLSIGEEDGKGNERVVEAGKLIADPANSHYFNYLGNVEGGDITSGEVDVIVTDGFTGNVALKSIEGAARATMLGLVDAIKADPIAKFGGLLAKRRLMEVRHKVDPNTTGGALLLGLRGVSVAAHGSSSPHGIAQAIRIAVSSVEGDVTGHMATAIAELDDHAASSDGVTVGVADDA